MGNTLTGTVIVLQGQAPDTSTFHEFYRQLERRVNQGATVIWLDGAPSIDPLYVTNKMTRDLPFHDRLFPAIRFDFQNTLGFHSQNIDKPVEESVRASKLEALRLLALDDDISLISISLPYSDHPHPETLHRFVAFKTEDDTHYDDCELLEIQAKGIGLPAGPSMPFNGKFYSMEGLFDSIYYWEAMQSSSGIDLDGGSEIDDLITVVHLGKRSTSHGKQKYVRYDDVTGEPHDWSFTPISDTTLARSDVDRLIAQLNQPLGQIEDPNGASSELRQQILYFLDASRDFSMRPISNLTVLKDENCHGLLVAIDSVIDSRKRKDAVQKSFDFDSVNLGNLSDSMQQVVAAARGQVEIAQADLARVVAETNKARADCDAIYADVDTIGAGFGSREAAVSLAEQRLATFEEELAKQAAQIQRVRDQKLLDDTKLIRELARIVVPLELLQNDRRWAQKRKVKNLKKELAELLAPHQDRLSQIVADVAGGSVDSEIYNNHTLSDAIFYVLAKRAIALSKKDPTFFGTLTELDDARFLTHRVQQATPEEEIWNASLEKQTVDGTVLILEQCLILASFEHLQKGDVTFVSLFELMKQIHFTGSRAVLDVENDTMFEVEAATRLTSPNANRPVALTEGGTSPTQVVVPKTESQQQAR